MSSQAAVTRPALKAIVFILAAIAALCVIGQTMLAGMAVFGDGAKWEVHENFVHLFEFIPVVVTVLAFFAKNSGRVKWPSLVVFVLIMLQYMSAHVEGAGWFHPVNALFIFWVAVYVALRAFREWRGTV